MRAPSQRHALGALFVVLAALFAGITVSAVSAEVWPIAAAGAVLALWLASLAARAWRPR
jgi:hypothetical protein